METFRIRLENDKEIPCFKRLKYEKAKVPVADVLRNGIHPWQEDAYNSSLKKRFVGIINEGGLKIPELEQFGYCMDVSHYSDEYRRTQFEDILQRIQGRVYFVEGLSFLKLVALAKDLLRRNWTHARVGRLLSRVYRDFNGTRAFLKSVDRQVKLSGYSDLERCPIQEILSLEHFEGEDHALVEVAIPMANFRLSSFIGKVADSRGYLRLIEEINDCQICVGQKAQGGLVYNCKRKGEALRFRPELDAEPRRREKANAFALKWRKGSGRFCFDTDMDGLTRMLEDDSCSIMFPNLVYPGPIQGTMSGVGLTEFRIPCFSIGKFLDTESTAESIRGALHVHGVSMTGRKEQLIEKLAGLSVKLYREWLPEMNAFFRGNGFIRMNNGAKTRKWKDFPVLEDSAMRNMVLTMYATKHLRGNTILDASHENNTYDLLSLAKALLMREVTLEGYFLRVE